MEPIDINFKSETKSKHTIKTKNDNLKWEKRDIIQNCKPHESVISHMCRKPPLNNIITDHFHKIYVFVTNTLCYKILFT